MNENMAAAKELTSLKGTLPEDAAESRFTDPGEPVELYAKLTHLDESCCWEEEYDMIPFDARLVLDSLAAVPEPDCDGADADYIAEKAMNAGIVDEWFGVGRSFQVLADPDADEPTLEGDDYREYWEWRKAIDGTEYQRAMTAAANERLSAMRVSHLSEKLRRFVREGYSLNELHDAYQEAVSSM